MGADRRVCLDLSTILVCYRSLEDCVFLLGALLNSISFNRRGEIVDVRYPPLPGSLGHEIWKRDFTGGASLFGVVFDPKYSREQVYAALRAAAATGTAVIVASSDHEQLAEICGRVLVFAGGGITAELDGDSLTKEQIAVHCYHGEAGGRTHSVAASEQSGKNI